MANITDWYGQNNINWGKMYSESWWGSVNEANSWGIIYPASAEGSIIYADTTLFTADMTSYFADNGTEADLGNGGDTPGTISSVDFSILTSISGVTSFSFTYGGTTYTRGMVDDPADITNYDGTSVSGWGTNPIEFDTDTIQVGSFVADGFGTFINSDDTHISSFGPYAAYSTPKYFRADFNTVGVFGNPLNAYPIYKVEQSNGYLKVTQKITS